MYAIKEIGSTQKFHGITDEVTLIIDCDSYFGNTGILQFTNNGYLIQFDWLEDARQVFEDIDKADPVELLPVLAQKACG